MGWENLAWEYMETLYAGIAVSLEAMTEPYSPSKIQIHCFTVGMIKPSDPIQGPCILWSINDWWGLTWNNILKK